MNHYIQTGDNPEITEERKKSTFDTEALGEYFWGVKNLKRRREIASYVKQHKEFDDPQPTAFMTREELMENAARKVGLPLSLEISI